MINKIAFSSGDSSMNPKTIFHEKYLDIPRFSFVVLPCSKAHLEINKLLASYQTVAETSISVNAVKEIIRVCIEYIYTLQLTNMNLGILVSPYGILWEDVNCFDRKLYEFQ